MQSKNNYKRTQEPTESRLEARYLEDPGASLRAVLKEGCLHLDALLLQVLRPPHGLQPLRGLDHLACCLVHWPHAVQSHLCGREKDGVRLG